MSSAEQMERVLAGGYDVVIATITPGTFSEAGYRASYLAAAEALHSAVVAVESPPKLIIWASSTSVYGDHLGDWVDESATPSAKSFSGRILRQAEQVIAQLPCQSVIVRFSGIYGPGRTRLVEQVASGIGRPVAPTQWSNRIHSDDCAAVFVHLINLHSSGASLHNLYLASDCEPVTQNDLRRWLAARMGVSLQERAVAPAPSRRCSNSRLLDSGFSFIYPSFREGYSALLSDLK
jgi:nucleoside-diphosphate-sugar epimerase